MSRTTDNKTPLGRILGVIPARGGSKGLPGKNIRPLAGKPLIAWTIQAALGCRWLDRVIVSTDDREIAGTARTWGADTPFMRPAELADDATPTIKAVIHAIRWLEENQGYRPDYVMLLQPTSPLRTSSDLEEAIRLAAGKEADAVISVAPVEDHPAWMKVLDSDGRMKDFLPGSGSASRRQELEPVYALNGAVYLTRLELVLEKETWYGDRTLAYVMPPERSLDIDNYLDFQLAELVLSNGNRNNN